MDRLAVMLASDGASRLINVQEQAGDTYIELLIAVVILAFVVVAILGAITSTLTASGEHRALANDDTIAKSALEVAKAQLEYTTTPARFLDCNGGANNAQNVLSAYTKATAPNPNYIDLSSVPMPNGYQVQVTGVQCLLPVNHVAQLDGSCLATTSGSSIGGCSSNDTTGTQLLTVTASGPNGVNISLSTIVRNPNFSSSDASATW